MSLRDAITEITTDMETEDHPILKSYAKQLRRVLKATEGEAAAPAAVNPLMMGMMGAMPGFGAEAQHSLMVEKARQELRAQRKALGLMEGFGEGQLSEGQTLVYMDGGPLDGTYVPAPSNVAVGNRCPIDGHIYRKEEGNRASYVGPIGGETAAAPTSLILP
jgi:hypothetical protein